MLGIDLVIPDVTYLKEKHRQSQRLRHHPRPRGPHRSPALHLKRSECTGLRHQTDDWPDRKQIKGAQPAPHHKTEKSSNTDSPSTWAHSALSLSKQTTVLQMQQHWQSTPRLASSSTPETSKSTTHQSLW